MKETAAEQHQLGGYRTPALLTATRQQQN